jgi:hypothetical protein
MCPLTVFLYKVFYADFQMPINKYHADRFTIERFLLNWVIFITSRQ